MLSDIFVYNSIFHPGLNSKIDHAAEYLVLFTCKKPKIYRSLEVLFASNLPRKREHYSYVDDVQ
jgi:hypothetical protein